MILVEFTGLPGSGKSYICNILKDILLKNNITVMTAREIKYSKKNPLKQIVWLYPLLCLVEFVLHNNSPLNIKRILATWFYNNKIFINKWDCDVIVLDQGIIQDILSLSHDKTISNRSVSWVGRLVAFYYSKFPKVYLLRVECDREKNINQLKKRNGIASRADRMPDNQLEELLEIQHRNFESILKALSGCEVMSIQNADQSLLPSTIESIILKISEK